MGSELEVVREPVIVRLTVFAATVAKNIPREASTIVAPDAVSMIIEPNNPRITLETPKIMERKMD